MAVRCADCGEELMGVVNRCWRCGRQFALGVDPLQPPPVRAEPPEIWKADDAIVATSEDAKVVADNSAVAAAHVLPRRVGSPFASGRAVPTPSPIANLPARRRPHVAIDMRRRAAAAGFAVASVVLALFAAAAFFVTTLASLPLSLAGLVMGVWGLRSDRMKLALAGLMLSCLVLMLTTYYGIAWIVLRM